MARQHGFSISRFAFRESNDNPGRLKQDTLMCQEDASDHAVSAPADALSRIKSPEVLFSVKKSKTSPGEPGNLLLQARTTRKQGCCGLSTHVSRQSAQVFDCPLLGF